MSTKHKIASAAGIIVLAALVSKVLGFILSLIVAAKFGATFKTDAYFVALNIPELLRDVLAGGALTSAFIPVYTSYLAKNQKREAQKLANGIFNILFVALILMSIFGIIFAPLLTKLVAPGFKGETLDLAIKLTRLFFPAIIFFGVASLFGAILNSHQHFTIPAFQPFILNASGIICLLLLAKKIDIYALVVGVIVGGIIITIINLPFLYSKGLRYLPEFNLSQPGIKKIGYLWFPLILGLSVNQINIVVNKMLASSLSSGSISALNYANLLNQVAPSVFGIAISTAIFPILSWQIALNEKERFREIVSKAIRVTLLTTIPLTVGFMFLSRPITKLLFERGKFDQMATYITSDVLFYFSIGTFALALNYVLIRAFYALSDTKLPVKLAIIAVGTNIMLNLFLVKLMAQNGLALGSSIAVMMQMIFLLIFLQKKIGQLGLKKLFSDFVKIIISAIISVGIGTFILNRLIVFWGQERFIQQLINLSIVFLLILLIYSIFIHFFKLEEKNMLLQIIKDRFEKVEK